jgi:arylsulfatase A-like enzyme
LNSTRDLKHENHNVKGSLSNNEVVRQDAGLNGQDARAPHGIARATSSGKCRRGIVSLVLIASALTTAFSAEVPPNIVLIYADDLGYGDVSCYGATAFQTPNVDRLAKEGLRFTDAHSPSATCTPSRYAMLTGEYAWRKKGTGILPGDAALIIEPGRATIASVLQKAGYRTGVVGKWHLGLGPQGGPDWNGSVAPGPAEIGFDYHFIMAATADRAPCVYVEDRRVVGLDLQDPIKVSYAGPIAGEPTGATHPELLRLKPSHGHDQAIVNGISRIGHMSGGNAARWKDEEMAEVFTAHAKAFIEKNAAQPFFLYFATHDPHVPRAPHPRFVGKSGLGARGDAILQMDWCVGAILETLDRLHLTEKTLIIFTSDNGPVLDDGYQDEAVARNGAHRAAGSFRGGKYSIFEGGTRVPFIVRWPARVKPGVSPALISHVDFLRTFATLTAQPLDRRAGPDSVNVLLPLLGEAPAARDHLVEHANTLALRDGEWKFIEPKAGPKRSKNTNIELGTDPQPQLYNLREDPGETKNLAPAEPEKTAMLRDKLAKIRSQNGKSEN